MWSFIKHAEGFSSEGFVKMIESKLEHAITYAGEGTSGIHIQVYMEPFQKDSKYSEKKNLWPLSPMALWC